MVNVKKMTTLLLPLIIAVANAQELKYEGLVKVDSTITKNELYNRARSWYADTYKSEKDVMSITDKDLGEISGNGAIRYDPQSFYFAANCARGWIMYKINIYVKQGRYKYNFHSFVHEGTKCPGGGGLVNYGVLTADEKPISGANKGWREVKELVNSRMENLIRALSDAMNKKHETSNDW